MGMYDKRIAEVENRLLPEAEFSNGAVVGRFAALAKRRDAPLVLGSKLPVVHHKEVRAIAKADLPRSGQPGIAFRWTGRASESSAFWSNSFRIGYPDP